MLGENTRAHDAPQRLVHRLQISYLCADSKLCASAPARLLRNLLVVVHDYTRASLHPLGGWWPALGASWIVTRRTDRMKGPTYYLGFPFPILCR